MRRSDRTPGTAFRLPRPRLARLLAGRWKFAAVCGPAGFGKTTLARQYATGRDALWVRVSPEDRDPARLLGAVLGAGLRAVPPIGLRTARLFAARRDFERDGGLLTGALLSELVPARGERLLVIDDLHGLAGAPRALAWLERLIESSGARVRVLATCRGEPPLPLARLDLAGGVRILDAEVLRFTADEQAALLRRGFGVVLDPNRQRELRARTGGFAAGLVLAAQQLARTGSAPGGPAPPGAEDAATLLAFMDDEVLAPLPDALRAALVRCAPLETLEPHALASVLSPALARRVIEAVARHDLFVERLEAEGAPRLHPLLRAALMRRFERDLPPAERRRLVARLARDAYRRGEPARAIRLLATQDVAAAQRLFKRVAEGPGASVAPAALGEAALDLHARVAGPARATLSPWLLLHGAVEAGETQRHDEARVLGTRALEGFMAQRQWLEAARACRFLCTHALVTGTPHAVRAEMARVATHLPAAEALARARVACARSDIELHCGSPSGARAAMAGVRRPRLALDRAEVAMQHATLEYTEGRWDRYVAIASGALRVFRRAGVHARAHALLLNLAEASIYLGHEDRALAYLDEFRHGLPAPGPGWLGVLEAELRARAWSEQGDLRAAGAAFAAARAQARAHGTRLSTLRLDVWEGVLARRRGRLTPAARLLTRALREAEAMHSPSWEAVARMELGLVLGLLGETRAARDALAAAATITRRHRDTRELARNHLFVAAALRNAHAPFRASLHAALVILARTRYFVLLRKEADVAVPLLAAVSGDRGLVARGIESLPAALRDRVRATGAPLRPPRGTPAAPRAAATAVGTGTPVAEPEVRLPIVLQLCGGFSARRGGSEVRFPRRAAAMLVARLALRPGEALSREALAEELWPGAAPGASRNRFDVTLNAARRVLEPRAPARGPWRVLRQDAGMCRLDRTAVRTDVEAFETLAGACEPRLRAWLDADGGARAAAPAHALAGLRESIAAALERHAGELLPEWPDALWAGGERERLRMRAARLRLGLARLTLAAGDAEGALAAIAPARAADALDEEALRLELRALVALHARAEAARRYRAFVRLLGRELAITPDPVTAALARELFGES